MKRMLGIIFFCINIVFSCPELVVVNSIEYQTMKIGKQCWIRENIRHEAQKGKYLLLEDTFYGGLYDFEAAKNVCPSGFLLPTKKEFEELQENAGISFLTAPRSFSMTKVSFLKKGYASILNLFDSEQEKLFLRKDSFTQEEHRKKIEEFKNQVKNFPSLSDLSVLTEEERKTVFRVLSEMYTYTEAYKNFPEYTQFSLRYVFWNPITGAGFFEPALKMSEYNSPWKFEIFYEEQEIKTVNDYKKDNPSYYWILEDLNTLSAQIVEFSSLSQKTVFLPFSKSFGCSVRCVLQQD
jgi:uncharacterized protein (TIGR02145 family)